jgi:hypothetical protein
MLAKMSSGGLGPTEGLWMGIEGVDVVFDGVSEIGSRAETPPA